MQCKAMSKKVIALVVVATMVAGTTPAYASVVNKNETVYVNLNESGNILDANVSTKISSDSALKNIKDKSSLNNVKNIKGDEEPKLEGGFLVWNSDSNDIYYNGKTNKPLPIDIKIDYELDGKKMNPKDIIGKSGQVKITINMKNNEKTTIKVGGKERDAYTPFSVAGTMILPKDGFSEVKLDGAQLVDDGDKQVVAFAAIPGLKETLQLDNFDKMKDTITVEAKTDKFELGPIMLVATPEIPELDEIEGIDNVDELLEALDKLNDGGEKLLEGTIKLLDGQKTFNDNMVVFNDGMSKVKSGFSELYGGVNAVKDKYPALLAKGQELIVGVNDLNNGLKSYNTKFDMFLGKLNQASQGADVLYKGLAGAQEQVATLKAGKAAENKGINDLVTNLENLIGALKNITSTLDDSLPQKPQYLAMIKNLENLRPELKKLQGSSDAINKGIAGLYGKLYVGDESKKEDSMLKGLENLDNGLKGLNAAGNQLSTDGSKKLESGSQQLANGVNSIANGNMGNLDEKLNTLLGGVNALNDGINTLSDGSNKLLKGSNDLTKGTGDLQDGARTLQQDGIGKLHEVGKEKITDGKELLEVKDEIVRLSKDYKSYAGISDDMEGKVKFVIKTEELKKDKNEEDKVQVKQEEKKGFIEWIKSLFGK